MTRKSYRTGREFLRPTPRMDAISWEVYVSPFTGRAAGQFEINWRSDNIMIHTLDQTKCKTPSDVLYVQKLETVIESISRFRKLLQSKENGCDRHWLNPLETSATGSVAYCFDKTQDKEDYTIYFELACCTSKFRMWVNQYTPRSIRELDTVMKKLQHQLRVHYAAMTDLQCILIKAAEMQLQAENKAVA